MDTTLRTLLDRRTTESIASTETEEFHSGQWSNLPSLPLEKIYSFVSRDDQLNMSLVCRKWSKGFGLPSVWKTFRFALTQSQLSMDTCPVMKFVRKYSSMFRHLEIHFLENNFNEHLTRTWCRNLIEFLQMLTSNSQLISVKFEYLTWYRLSTDTPTYHDICRAICNFLGSQHHLKRVEFHQCSFDYQEGAEILKSLTENNRESLTYLVLSRFLPHMLENEERDSIAVQHLPKLVNLPSLTTLEIDYQLIFGCIFARESTVIEISDIIESLKNFQCRILLKITMSIFAVTKTNGFKRLTSEAWRFLKQLCPNLQVELLFSTNSPSRRRVGFFVVKYMPITHLWYNFAVYSANHPSVMEIDALFYRLRACEINDHLVFLCLVWVLPIPDLASSCIPFLLACKKLKCLELFIVYPVNGIDVLMKSWIDNRPESLERVLLDISDIENEDNYNICMNLTTEYLSRLEMVGLNVKVDLNFKRFQ
ncbi:hypothetical protein AVEN_264925-1 [Araneus ventricosus]|uniref:F-box domain-containing protein n=1 Tax=Araneus ventricosus TaxID=182803 RepID=A0A4Y2GZP6_ARAVE|nr:hypothetical protein AVEN_264925-1 [Araneus ventricosus]